MSGFKFSGQEKGRVAVNGRKISVAINILYVASVSKRKLNRIIASSSLTINNIWEYNV